MSECDLMEIAWEDLLETMSSEEKIEFLIKEVEEQRRKLTELENNLYDSGALQ